MHVRRDRSFLQWLLNFSKLMQILFILFFKQSSTYHSTSYAFCLSGNLSWSTNSSILKFWPKNIPFFSWPFGDLVCVLVPLIQYSCVYVSTFTMTLIALHRLWTVRQRRSSVGKTSGTKVALTVLAIWLVALTLSLPHAAFNRVKAKQFNVRARVGELSGIFNFN